MREDKIRGCWRGNYRGPYTKMACKRWRQVKEDESILQVETDKAVVNMPAPINGFIKIVAKEDSIVKVGDLIAQIGTKEEISVNAKCQHNYSAQQSHNSKAQPSNSSNQQHNHNQKPSEKTIGPTGGYYNSLC